ncbi:MAG: ATP synthase F1 subunit gamma [Paludibacteraceae bacterium]|nr:ATP synthase F1 subunit gamma [Paludibacteraceae bacterium]
MASLKEVRARISSVTSTSKITSAMKLVSAAKLRRAQDAIVAFLPYKDKLSEMLENFVASSTEELSMPLAAQRKAKRVAIVAIASNSSLCGAFNSNIIKRVQAEIKSLQSSVEGIEVYAIGKKISQTFEKMGLTGDANYDNLVDTPDYDKTGELVDKLVQDFLEKKIDKVLLVYNHFKNTASQEVRCEQFLPVAAKTGKEELHSKDYILEPDANNVIGQLLPRVVRLNMYGAILDSIASEHGARTTAMQIATDNALDLLQELKLSYNKARQAAITNELIDIVSGSEGQK